MARCPTEGGASAPPAPVRVVPIRPKIKLPKANRSEDQAAITHRRLMDGMDNLAGLDGKDGRAASAIGEAARRKLPSNNLRCIVTSDVSPEQVFWLSIHKARVAIAEFNLVEAQFALACQQGDDSDLWRERRAAAEQRRNEAVEDCLRTPSVALWHVREQKASLIKAAQLFGKGDAWRAMLREEEERLRGQRKQGSC